MAYDKDAWRASVTNGEIPHSMLAEVEPSQYDPDLGGSAVMHPEAAAAMSALIAEAREAGHLSLAVKYSYRTIGKQWEKWIDYQNGGNLAAYPGTSNHGWAVAVDFTGLSTAVLAWLHSNAERFGFHADVPGENWHYTYYGGFTQEDEMTPEERERLKDVEAWQSGYDEAIAGKPQPPTGARPARKRGYKAGTKALNSPKATG